MAPYGPARGGRIPTWVRPPKEAQRVARKALKRRRELPKSKRGGLDAAEARAQGVTSGVLRAESIAKGEWQPAEDINAFFQRFESTHEGAQDKLWDDSKVQQAWDLWGGDAMWRAAQKALKREENPYEHTGGGCLVGTGCGTPPGDYPCDDDFEDEETGETVNVQTTSKTHFDPAFFQRKFERPEDIEKVPGVKKGSLRRIPNPREHDLVRRLKF